MLRELEYDAFISSNISLYVISVLYVEIETRDILYV